MESWICTAGVLPGELLEELGVESEPIRIVVTVLALLSVIAGGLTALFKVIRWARRRLRLRDRVERERLGRRQLFANFVEARVRDLDRREEWADYRFAELEAEIETVEDGDPRRGLKHLFRRRDGLRREKSLSKTLVRSSARLILLRGDPGSGKSVALRHVTRKLARAATESKRLDAVIPLYVNLKDLRRGSRPVDVRLIEDFVLETVERGGDREVHSFLQDEFEAGKAAGGWLFLFDSFDELPEVLSSTEDDEIVRNYSDAISQFVEGMHSCRGVIASRHFRAPKRQGPPIYRIVPLTEKRKLDLIAKAHMGELEGQLVTDLAALPPELAALSANPLFLGLLVEFVKDRQQMPEGWHDVFEAFVSRRLETDRERVRQLFRLSHDTLRTRSEEIAFTMTETVGFGLSPTRDALQDGYRQAGFGDGQDLEVVLSALAWTKLARLDTEVATQGEETFTFAHRRFQEYFATCVVLREPGRVPAETLLTDGSWRETAVTLCHAQPEAAESLIKVAEGQMVEAQESAEAAEGPTFRWKPGTLHLLGLLQSAFAGRTNYLPDSLRRRVAAVLRAADEKGSIADRKWALEAAGTAPADDMAALLLKAFRGRSDWLREVAYRQVARLGEIPFNVSIEIKRALVERAVRGELLWDWSATKAQLMRLQPPDPFLRAARLLRVAPLVDALVFFVGYLVVLMAVEPAGFIAVEWAAVAVIAVACYFPMAMVIARLPEHLVHGSGTDSDFWDGLRSGLGGRHFTALLIRALVAILPLLIAFSPFLGELFAMGLVPWEVAHGDASKLGALLWLYASTWSLAATYLSLVDQVGIPRWLLFPPRVLWLALKRMRTVNIPDAAKLVGIGIAGATCVGAGVFALIWCLDQMPSPWDAVVSLLVSGVILSFSAHSIVGAAVAYVRDWVVCRRWLESIRSGMNPADLIACLDELRRAANANRILREVRSRELLLEHPEAPAAVRDLLQAITFIPGKDGKAPPLNSRVFGEWLEVTDQDHSWLRYIDGVSDELGRLLEELERKGEVPVA